MIAVLCMASPSGWSAAADTPTQASTTASRLTIFPTAIHLDGQASRQQIVVTSQEADAERDVTRQVRFTPSVANTISISETGVITPVTNGELQLDIALGDITQSISVKVTRAGENLPLDFARDIEPILTKRGCNGGGCHGKLTGQGGFRLSLFGYNPQADANWITRDSTGRRVQPLQPDQSLLLLKPTQVVPHGGGRRLTRGEPEYVRLSRWIAQCSLPQPTPEASPSPTLARLTVYPAQRALAAGARQQLVSTAFFSDGSQRDVTRLTTFRSNESTIADVDNWGLVTAHKQLGETAIVATYSGQVAISRIQRPWDRRWEPSDMPTRNRIDTLLLQRLAELRVPPSALCDDDVFLRRATQQIAGRLPTPLERDEFHKTSTSSKREELIDRLLDDPGYADHFAQKWSGILRNKRRGQTPRIPGTIAFHRWIRNAIARNVPYDKLVRDILTATGNVTANPPAQWYAEVRYLDRYVDDTAQLFLGTRIACARCHHHPFENISQRDYYGLAAFFARVDRKGGSGVAERRANESIFIKATGETRHPLTGQTVPPHGLGGPDLDIAPYEDPRHQLVDWMIQPDNPYFARAYVNRIWAHFFGQGLVEPIDDLRVTNPATNAPLLDWLATTFIEHKFDMRFLVRTICTSATYQLSSQPNEDNLQDKQNFSRFYPQRMRAEVLLDSVDQVTGVATTYSGLPQGTRALQLPDEGYSNSFLKVFGRPPRESACECERVSSPSLSQSLLVMNDQFLLGKLTNKNSLAIQLGQSKASHRERVRLMFETILTREPRADEMQDTLQYLESEADAARAYGNVIWALLNTKEFLYIH